MLAQEVLVVLEVYIVDGQVEAMDLLDKVVLVVLEAVEVLVAEAHQVRVKALGDADHENTERHD